MLEVIKPITNENTFNKIEPIKQTNNILIFIKYEYLSRYGDPAEELYDIETTENTTIKQIKDELNKSFIFGELDPDQYEIYKGGEQEDKERPTNGSTFYYTYTEPQLLDDDNKTLKECNIKDGELLHLKAKLKILLYVPCCRFNTRYFYTYNTLEDIRKEAANIYNEPNGIITRRPQQIKAFYGDKELQEHEQLSTHNICNYSTIKTDIDYNRNQPREHKETHKEILNRVLNELETVFIQDT